MKYILFGALIFFVACSKEQSNSNGINITKKVDANIKNYEKVQEKGFTKKIVIDNLELIFKNNKLIYPNERVILFFENNSRYSKAQELALKRLKTKYIKVDSQLLKDYFNITIFPTIIILDKNKVIRYENFVPYEILKAEGF